MNKSFNTLAAAILLGSTAIAPLAIAQDATGGASGTTGVVPSTDTMAPVDPAMPEGGNSGTTADPSTATGNTTMGTGNNAVTDPNAAATMNADAAGEIQDYVTTQTEGQMRVSDFMGQAVYTADNETIGDINDLLVQRDGGIVAAVVGVGGFLGIGEKDVALPMSKITLTRENTEGDVEGEVRLMTTETADSLRNAPEFVPLDEQDDVMNDRMGEPAADAVPGTTGTTGTTTPSTDN
ncbi:PRC-barrel domain-containing protein [Peteryoungia desertarenae]|uniref:PRC-barrel domain-containing protein n=1 Tax=Peteryoungia desertarenae TaxID=1813451 RepID=A0ABX6QM38_9HYPH|nr:PRC-barrel domain-containing protein [Peteryoungia desertarenae]QLF69537.1 PRC-barrel domain-containing protein [Peteryoungia desertarenae]